MGKKVKPSIEELSKLAQSLTNARDSKSSTPPPAEPEPKDPAPPEPDVEEPAKKRRMTGKKPEKAEKKKVEKHEMPPPPVPSKKRSPEEPPKDPPNAESQAELGRKKSKIFSVGDRVRLQNFDPQSLPFKLDWANYEKLKAEFALDDPECTSVLLAACGPTPEGEAYWGKFKLPPVYANMIGKTTPEVPETREEDLDGEELEEEGDFEEDPLSEPEEPPPTKVKVEQTSKVAEPVLDQHALDARAKLDGVKNMPTPSKTEPC